MQRAILIISADEVNYVEKSTRNQSSSAVRHDQRAGQITSPTVQDILRTDVNRPAPSIVKKICRKHKQKLQLLNGKIGMNYAYLLYYELADW